MQIVLEPVNRLRKDPLICRFTRVHPLFEPGKKGDIFILALSIVIVWSKHIAAGTTLKAWGSGFCVSIVNDASCKTARTTLSCISQFLLHEVSEPLVTFFFIKQGRKAATFLTFKSSVAETINRNNIITRIGYSKIRA
ncbi:hypothetical protein DP190_05045 [Enterobacter cloacae]|nr:hypothetical protein DP190_05045 [Enterobacter cloacae]